MSSKDKAFMKVAIEEALKCSGEDERIHPMVGAVVVKDGNILATGYRGELSPGEHAEFTVMERKLRDAILTGSTVYTTLEPCTTRNHPKVPCAERLIERKVSRVFIGMLDPDPEITGKGQRRLREANITTELFPPDLMSIVEEMNRFFTREKTKGGLEKQSIINAQVNVKRSEGLGIKVKQLFYRKAINVKKRRVSPIVTGAIITAVAIIIAAVITV